MCHCRIVLAALAISFFPYIVLGQDTAAPAPGPVTVVSMSEAEKQFQQTLSGVTLVGFYTVGDSPESRPDKYTIERVVKIGDDLWNIDARIEYNNREFKATVKTPVKWAGDTPVLSLSNYLIKDHGVFSARILIHNGMYAGTWGGQERGGKMFGKIVRNETLAK